MADEQGLSLFEGASVSIQPANRTKDHSSVLVSSGYSDHWSLFICVLNHLFPLDLAWSGLTVLRFLPLRQRGTAPADKGPYSVLHMGEEKFLEQTAARGMSWRMTAS